MTNGSAPTMTAQVAHALQQLDAHGGVTLPGRLADATLHWFRVRRRWQSFAIGVLAVGAGLMVAGGVRRDAGVFWALAIPFGALLAFCGAVWAGVVLLLRRQMNPRRSAETQPVTIDPLGVTLRGIGPLPWTWLAPPERRRVPVRNDIGGVCTLMPLTPEGHSVVNAQPGWWRHLVGPKPYLRFDIPYLLLPGIEGLTEEETMYLFRIVHERFAQP